MTDALHDRVVWTFEVEYTAPHGPDDLLVRKLQLEHLIHESLVGQPGRVNVTTKAVQSRKANP